ncbi:unnamed protein product [Dovyalis caffra]|uniref:Uncharacterized protein n=1 Tax=Dovyalis caffra TaxID=77055 RepID=A0AAV1RT02_9ROSI|nr:unnamed protein product [Dovyalis caffra]
MEGVAKTRKEIRDNESCREKKDPAKPGRESVVFDPSPKSKSVSTENLNIPLRSTSSSLHGFDRVNKVEDSSVFALMMKRRSLRDRWGFTGFRNYSLDAAV